MAQQFSCTGCHNSTKVASLTVHLGIERKEKTKPFGINLMRSQVLYWAAQDHLSSIQHAHAQAMSANLGYKLLGDVDTSARI